MAFKAYHHNQINCRGLVTMETWCITMSPRAPAQSRRSTLMDSCVRRKGCLHRCWCMFGDTVSVCMWVLQWCWCEGRFHTYFSVKYCTPWEKTAAICTCLKGVRWSYWTILLCMPTLKEHITVCTFAHCKFSQFYVAKCRNIYASSVFFCKVEVNTSLFAVLTG